VSEPSAETTSSQQPTEHPPPGAPRGGWDRLDRAIYDAEQALVVGGLLVMTATYALTVLWGNMTQRVNSLDRIILRFGGYPDIQTTPEPVLATVTGVVTPLVFVVISFTLALFAIRTRERAGLEPGERPPPPNWGRRLLWSAVVTAGFFGLLMLVKVLPGNLMGVVAVVGLVALTLILGPARASLASMVSAVVGGVVMAIFFVWKHESTSVDDGSALLILLPHGDEEPAAVASPSSGYPWNAGLGAVLLMYVGFLGASMATRDERHIKVDAIRKTLKGPGHHLYNAISGIVTALFTVFLGYMAIQYFFAQAERGIRHQGTDLPEIVVLLPICFAFIMMVVRFAVRVRRSFEAWQRGEDAPTTVELH